MTVVRKNQITFDQLPGRLSGDPLRELAAASSVRIVRLSPSRTRSAHRHPHSEEVVYVRSGRGTAFIDGIAHSIGPGDVVHIPTGLAHATIPDPGEAMELVCFFPHPNLRDNIEDTDIEITIEERP